MQSLVIPKNVNEIMGVYTFYGCNSLQSLTVEEGNTVYDSRQNCNAIVETKSAKLIAACANSHLVDGIKTIGDLAFSGVAIRELSFPKTLTQIEPQAFSDCKELSTVSVAEDNPLFCSPFGSNVVLTKDSTTLVLGCTNSVILNNVSKIASYAFAGKYVPEILYLPKGLKVIGDYAFSQCDNLFQVVLPSSVTSIGEGAFYGCRNLSVTQLQGTFKELPEMVFGNCEKLVVVNIPEGVENIRRKAFSGCRTITNLRLPSSLLTIDKEAFYGCSLQGITPF